MSDKVDCTTNDITFPPMPESIESLCLRCPLMDCNERAAGCLIRQTVEADPKLKSQVHYLSWLHRPENRAKRRQAGRDSYNRSKDDPEFRARLNERRRRSRRNRSAQKAA